MPERLLTDAYRLAPAMVEIQAAAHEAATVRKATVADVPRLAEVLCPPLWRMWRAPRTDSG